MSVVKSKYRGTTTYQDIAVIMGLPTRGAGMGQQTGQILGEISEDEVHANRPMLSAVAVNVAGKAGPGFYWLAKQLKRQPANQDDLAFWEHEVNAVYEAWRRPLPKK